MLTLVKNCDNLDFGQNFRKSQFVWINKKKSRFKWKSLDSLVVLVKIDENISILVENI